MKRQVPIALCFITGAFVVFAFFIGHPSVVDLKLSLAFRTDFFTLIEIINRIETERAFQIDAIVKKSP